MSSFSVLLILLHCYDDYYYIHFSTSFRICSAPSCCSCATAYILLAEEEATTIVEAERLFKQALKAGEGCYRRSQQLQHHGTQYEAQHSKQLPVCATALAAEKEEATRAAALTKMPASPEAGRHHSAPCCCLLVTAAIRLVNASTSRRHRSHSFAIVHCLTDENTL